MQKKASQKHVGAHRKHTVTASAKSRVALVAVATGAVSTAGAGGAAVATATTVHTTEHAQETTPDYVLAADAADLTPEQAPQILEIQEYKPTLNLQGQLEKAIHFNEERVAADEAARAPMAVKPAEGTFTSSFGPRWGTFHAGIDIANSLGTPIRAAEDGVVISAGPASGFGQWVRVQHEDGTITVYGHIETIDVTEGQRVVAGQKIAGMGSRGFSTGVHLHFEVHPGGGAPIDPVPWLAARGISV